MLMTKFTTAPLKLISQFYIKYCSLCEFTLNKETACKWSKTLLISTKLCDWQNLHNFRRRMDFLWLSRWYIKVLMGATCWWNLHDLIRPKWNIEHVLTKERLSTWRDKSTNSESIIYRLVARAIDDLTKPYRQTFHKLLQRRLGQGDNHVRLSNEELKKLNESWRKVVVTFSLGTFLGY